MDLIEHLANYHQTYPLTLHTLIIAVLVMSWTSILPTVLVIAVIPCVLLTASYVPAFI